MDDEGGHFMRVRVTLDLTLPLCQGRVITLAVGGGEVLGFLQVQAFTEFVLLVWLSKP